MAEKFENKRIMDLYSSNREFDEREIGLAVSNSN